MTAHVVMDDGFGGKVRVSPARDVAHYWGQLAAAALVRLEDESTWPAALAPALREAGITSADMARAGTKLVGALELATRRGNECPRDAMRRSGFLDCHPLIQAAIFLRIGQVSYGAWWDGIKDSTIDGTVPACSRDLIETGLGLAAALQEEFRTLPDLSASGDESVT